MSRLVMGLGVVFLLLGLWIAVVPDQVLSIVDWESRQGLYLAAGMRIVLGLLLILSASATRYPMGIRIFGGAVLVAGLCLLFIPIDLWMRLMHWAVLGNPFFRVGGGLFGLLFGTFLVYVAKPGRSKPTSS